VLQWPDTFRRLIGSISFVNFNFLHLKETACATPRLPLVKITNGVASAIALLILYIIGLWLVGRVIMQALGMSPERRLDFDRTTVQRVVVVMQLAYAPIVESVLAVFNCRRIAGTNYLREDVAQLCSSDEYSIYQKAAVFWTIWLIAGIPLCFLALLYFYNVPAVARELTDSSYLKALVTHAHSRGIPQPPVDIYTLSVVNAPEELVLALYDGFCAPEALPGALTSESQNIELPQVYSPHGTNPPLSVSPRHRADDQQGQLTAVVKMSEPFEPISAAPPRSTLQARLYGSAVLRQPTTIQQKLHAVVAFAKVHLRPHTVTWKESKDDPRLQGAFKAIGPIFEEVYACKWYCALPGR
jgi:hypothetical protein